MYIDFSLRKALALAGFLVAIVLSITVFVAANSKTGATARFAERVSRMEGQAAYWVGYKFPHDPKDLLAYFSGSVSVTRTSDSVAEGIPVLLYHGEGEHSDMPESTFVAQLRALKADGWRTITLAEFRDFMKGGKPVPAKSFLLTFDDGRRDTFYAADPVLEDLGFHAVMFIITGFSLPQNGPDPINNFYLSRSELSYMKQSGRWDLESHGEADHWLYDIASASSTPGDVPTIPGGHFLSNRFWLSALGRLETPEEYRGRITSDLVSSKKILEDDFNVPVDAFAFPYNDYGQDSLNYPPAKEAVGEAAASVYDFGFIQVDPQRTDFFNYADPGIFFVKRVEPLPSWKPEYLVSLFEEGAPRTLPFSAQSFGAEWGTTWGSVTPGTAGLRLSATKDTTGAAAILLGSENWRNYSAKASGEVSNGEFSILARVPPSGDGTFLSCTLAASRIFIEEKTSGTERTLASAPFTPPQGTGRTATFLVSGGQASCSAYDASVSAATNVVHAGNMGVQVWSARPGEARLTVTDVRITAQ